MTTSMKTFSPRPRDIERRWYVVDADGAVLGRLASEVAKILRGKHKPIFAPHADTGDHVIVVNAGGVRLTGAKQEDKVYYRHSNYPGGLAHLGYARLMAERPVLVVEKAIKGMLPKNRLGRQMLTKLNVYEGGQHPHQAQKPQPLKLGDIPKWEGLPKPKPPAPPKEKPKRTPKAAAPAKRSTSKRATSARSTAKRTSAAKPAPAKSAPTKTSTRRRITRKKES